MTRTNPYQMKQINAPEYLKNKHILILDAVLGFLGTIFKYLCLEI